MKTKLLKKIRKRFEIYNYPEGTNIWGENISGNLMILYDDKERIEFKEITDEHIMDSILNHFRNIILRKVKKEYSAYSGKREIKRIKIKW